MSAELEKYMKKERKSLDVESPDDQLIWEGIRNGIQRNEIAGKKKGLLSRFRNIAAVVVILLSVGYMVLDLLEGQRAEASISLADIDRNLGERERGYRALVSFKQQEVGVNKHIDNLIIAELFEEIQKLDTIYDQTMKDLDELGYNERVINTIFDTYEKKIYLLELIILENNKIKNHEEYNKLFL